MLWSYPCLADASDMTQIGEKILSVPLWCLIELASPAVPGGQCLDQSSSIKHKLKKEKIKRMDLNYYLSMACLIVLSNGGCVHFFSLLLSYLLLFSF